MKKVWLSLSLIVLTYAVNAQRTQVGLKGGLNLATLGNSESANFNNRLAYNAGLFVNVPFTRELSIQPEFVYSSQGAKYTDNLGLEHSLALNYINIPVLLQANVGRGFYAEAGPQIGFLTSVTDRIDDTETGFFTSDDFKNTDVSLAVGLGFKSRSGIGLGARYNFGLSNINDFGSNNIKNNVLQIGVNVSLSGR